LIMSQNSQFFSAAAGALLAALILYAFVLNQRGKQFVSLLYGKLPQQDQMLVRAVASAEQSGNASTQNVVAEFEKLSGIAGSGAWVELKLQEAEESGLIKKNLFSVCDCPVVSWVTQLPSKRSFFGWLPF